MKMKKLIAVLLICVMMFALAVPALGETCYGLLKAYFSGEVTTSSMSYLGTPQVLPLNDATKAVALMYNAPEEYMMLTGFNSKGQSEMSVWPGVDVMTAFSVFYDVCSSWELLSSVCEPGYKLWVLWDYGEGNLCITSSEDAAMFVEMLSGR